MVDHYIDFYIENKESKAKVRSYAWIITSGILHTALAIGILTMTIDIIMPEKPQLIEFEVSSAGAMAPDLSMPAQLSAAPEIKSEPVVAAAPLVAAPELPKEEVATSPVKELPAKKVVTKKTVSKPVAAKPVAVAAAIEAQPTEDNEADVEDTINKPVAAVVPVEKFDDKNIDEDLSKIDKQEEAKLSAVKADLDKQTENEMQENEQQIAALEKQHKQEEARMAAIAAEKKSERQAAEKAYAENIIAQQNAAAAAKAAADAKAASEKANAERLAAARAAQNAKGNSTESGNAAVAGVRALEDLKQMPGNRKPEYDSDDRLARRQGEVNFIAYVSRDGKVTQFKMMKSTGHRELDLKTLKAIKDWKFYPGQEGWVEIPFKWDLKGGPQEMPATLRTKISQK